MLSWVASWYYGEDITKDETIYQVEDATDASPSGDLICTTGKSSNEWTWIEAITDQSSEKKTQLLIQSTRIIDDGEDKLISLKKIMRKYFKNQCRQLPQRIYAGVNERNSKAINRLCSTKGTCTERQLVRYCPQYKLNMGITGIKLGDDIRELLLHLLVNIYRGKDQINESKQPKRDLLMIEWKKEGIENKDHCTKHTHSEDRSLVTSFHGKATRAALRKAWVKKSSRVSKLSRTTRRVYRNTPISAQNKHLKGEVALMRKFVIKKAKKEEGSKKFPRISTKSLKLTKSLRS